jgi:DNA-directed RNA polymerase specialized sigma24 family protein
MLGLTPGDAWGDHEKALRRFAMALARDDIAVRDDRAAAALAEPLLRQSLLALRNAPPASLKAEERRAQLFRHFIQRYHRHIRKSDADEDEANWALASAAQRTSDLRSAVHRLPLELREALLLVIVAGFSHVKAAETLDIPLTRLTERLGAARRALGGSPHQSAASAGSAPRPNAPYLRLIK